MPQYPTGERPANLHEHVPAAIPAEERLQTLCENAVNIETDKLQSAFQGDAAYIAEAGARARRLVPRSQLLSSALMKPLRRASARFRRLQHVFPESVALNDLFPPSRLLLQGSTL